MLCDLGLHRVDPATVWNGGVALSRCLRCQCQLVRQPGAQWEKVPSGYSAAWRPDALETEKRDWRDAATWLETARTASPVPLAPAPALAPMTLFDEPPAEPEEYQFDLLEAIEAAPVRDLSEPEPAGDGVLFTAPEQAVPDDRVDWSVVFASERKPSTYAWLRATAATAWDSVRRLRTVANRSLSLLDSPREQASRTYRYLVQRIAAQSERGKPIKTVLVSAVCGAEAANEALLLLSAMMQDELGGRLLVIDATLRDGGIGTQLGARGIPGLSEARPDDPSGLSRLVRPLGRDSLFLLGAGLEPGISRPEHMAGILPILAEQFDHILIQQYAITADTRYLAMAGRADLVLVLAEEGQSRMATLTQCRDAFRSNGIANVGLILTVPPTEQRGPAEGDMHAA